MSMIVTLVYILFSICVIHPPAEFVSAGFTIPQLFDNYLGSENMNFIKYHMNRITLTALIHSALPPGYIATLWCLGVRGDWMLVAFSFCLLIPMHMIYKILGWWESDKTKHPVVKALLPYVTPENDWQAVANSLNPEYRSSDKMCITLNATSKFIVTETWLIKVTQYAVDIVKQSDCTLVATTADRHILSTSGEEEVQYVNIEAVPTRDDIKGFNIRISTSVLRDLQPRLERPVRVPEHIVLLPSIIERFVNVFKEHIESNPVYYTDQELELCIGCMHNQADVKLNRHCQPSQPDADERTHPPCQQCNCRVLWCAACMARWWATRAGGAPGAWLAARGACPVCRAPFCLLDVCPARAC